MKLKEVVEGVYVRIIRTVFICTLISITFTACDWLEQSNGVDESLLQLETFDPSSTYQLKIMADKDFFMSMYGKILLTKYPNITFDFIGYPEINAEKKELESYLEHIAIHQPDIIDIYYGIYLQLSQQGALFPLDDYLKFTQLDTEIHPAVLDRLREADHRYVYGLSPFFVKDGLFYNETIFERAQMQLPEDHMTWEEVINLAERLLQAERDNGPLYGIFINDVYGKRKFLTDLFFQLGQLNGLTLLSEDEKRMEIPSHANEWKDVLSYLKQKIDQQVFIGRNLSDPGYDYFIEGEAAMTLAANIRVDELRRMRDRWGVVSEPVGKTFGNQSYSIQLREVLSIPKDTENLAAAWEVLKYIHSEEMAKFFMQKYDHIVYSHLSSASRWETFYVLEHAFEKADESILNIEAIDQTLKQYMDGEISLDDAVEQMGQIDVVERR